MTRADERHDRVDVVSRGFLGLTVGCARCHNHKYDPIPTKDYYALSGVFLNTMYHEYPMVPQDACTRSTRSTKSRSRRAQKLLDDFMSTESKQLGETLAFQAAKYMQSAWKVTGPDKAEVRDGGPAGQARLRTVRALDQVPGQAAQESIRT